MRCVRLGIVPGSGNDLLRIVARLIAFQAKGQPCPALAVGSHLGRIPLHGSHRRTAGEDGVVVLRLRLVQLAVHPLQIRHGPARQLCRHLQPEHIHRLQQHALGPHKAMAHRPVRGLPEIPALGMLQMGFPRQQGDLHVRDL